MCFKFSSNKHTFPHNIQHSLLYSRSFKRINQNRPSSYHLPIFLHLGLLWFVCLFVCFMEEFLADYVIFLLAWKTPTHTILYRIDILAFVIINFIQINCKLNYCNLALINKYLRPFLIHTFI